MSDAMGSTTPLGTPPRRAKSSRAPSTSVAGPSTFDDPQPVFPSTFTTCLSIPVVGTRLLKSDNKNKNTSEAVIVPAGPANPTRMSRGSTKQPSGIQSAAKPASSRTTGTTATDVANAHEQQQQTASTSLKNAGTPEKEKDARRHPNLGIPPIHVAEKLDMNTVRTSVPRVLQPAKGKRPFEIDDVPAFYPTAEEFVDPMGYLRSIRPKAEQYGICKIIPPETWKMPFVTNTETFRFKTRIQRLNQVEASTRAKLNFLEQLYRYHATHSPSPIIVPTVNHHQLDLWLLRKEVHKLDGFAAVSKANKWNEIGRNMGYSAIPGVGSQLKVTYQRIIMPFDNFLANLRSNGNAPPSGPHTPGTPGRNHDQDVTMTGVTESPTVTRMTTKGARGAPMSVVDKVAERKQAMANGAESDRSARTKHDAKANGNETYGAAMDVDDDENDKCEVCGKGDREKQLLLCDACNEGYHTFCLDPPLASVPKGQWFCHACLDGSNHEFGFDEGEEHSLTTFQARDLAFRKLWFESHPPANKSAEEEGAFDPAMVSQIGAVKVSEYDVEREFWRLVQSAEDTVEVEYGADVHSTSHGSGMPTLETHPLEAASKDPWNLNNLPIISDSLLRFIKTDISGMTVPWTYVGMVFSTFCWHNEDHYTYSINYMHWGETKTWYSIPGSAAEKFEEALRSEAPDLFDSQPDLLFQLVTLMTPERLTQAGVPVYACNQRPGEFVVTSPKAYHCGFNHGLNFNEAVNFALPDWLPFGLEGAKRYKEHFRAPVFSHDELLVTMSQHSTSIKTAMWLQDHLREMTVREMTGRELARSTIPNIQEVVDDGDRPEEEYQCSVCKEICYLSHIVCLCRPETTCHEHAALLCGCPLTSRILRMRYSDKDLEEMISKVLERAAQPQAWRLKLTRLLAESPRPQLRQLRALVGEGERINYPLPELANLRKCVVKANEWIEMATQVVKRKESTRKRARRAVKQTTGGTPQGFEEEYAKTDKTLRDAQVLLDQVEKLGFDAPEINVLSSVILQAKEFKEKALELLARLRTETDSFIDIETRRGYMLECQELQRMGSTSNIGMEEMTEVDTFLKKYQLMNELDHVAEEGITLSDVRMYLERVKVCNLDESYQPVQILRRKLELGEDLETKANAIFTSPVKNMKDLEEFADLPPGYPIDPSVLSKIHAIRSKAKEFERQAKALMFPEGTKRTKITDSIRLVTRAEKDFIIPAVSELKRVVDFAQDLETRCDAVLNKRHPQSDAESVFDSIRKWRIYAEEHLTNKFQLPQFDTLRAQLDQHDKWYNKLPFPKPRREHVEALYKDVAECTKTEEDAAPTEEYCTCICTMPVRPPPPGTASDAVQCDHCHARFHPQCAGGSCPFCDHHHWNGSLHRTRYYHSFDVLACVRPVPDLTKNYSRLWKQIEFIATRIARLQNVITHFLAFAAQTGNQRAEIIPQVRHYMRKLFKIQLAISPKPNVSYGLDLAGLHRILAGQRKSMKRRRRPKFIFRQDTEKVANDGTQCFCHGQPAVRPGIPVKCSACPRWYHASCVKCPIPMPPDFTCPLCTIRRLKDYPHCEVRIRAVVDEIRPGVYINIKATVEHGGRELIRYNLPTAEGQVITLEMISYLPPDLYDATSGDPPLNATAPISPVSGNGMQLSASTYHGHPAYYNGNGNGYPSLAIQQPPTQLPAQALPSPSAPERKRKHDEQLDPRAEMKRRKSDKGGAPLPTTSREVIDLTVDPSVLSAPPPGTVAPSQTIGTSSGKQPKRFSYTFVIPPVGPWPSPSGSTQPLSDRWTLEPQHLNNAHSLPSDPPILPHAMLPDPPPDISMFSATEQPDVMDLTAL